MRKVALVFALALVGFTSLTAQTDSVTVFKNVNEMTDVVSWRASERAFAISHSDENRGLIIQPSMSDNGEFIRTLIVTPYKLGSCNENNTLIIKFVDGSKVKLSSWNKFDCDNTYFDLTNSLESKFKTVEVEKIYYQNGRTYDSGTFPLENPRYFIQLYKGLK